MTFTTLVEGRESCRRFDPRPVSREALLHCLSLARLAPSACNSQPWRFVAVYGDMVKEVAHCVQKLGMNRFTEDCPAFIVIYEENANLAARLGGRVADQHYAPIDIGIATAHLCYAAAEQGLSTCILGWFDAKKLSELLKLPDPGRIRLVLAVGYAAEGTVLREKSRKPLSQLVSFPEEE